MRRFSLTFMIMAVVLIACSHSATPENAQPLAGEMEGANSGPAKLDNDDVSPVATPTVTISPSPTLTPTATRLVVGPGYSEGINPLTGMSVDDVNTLREGPLLISITNFPISARPQSGLSFASHVWETSIGEGMTRFIGVFYGDYLNELNTIKENLDATYERDFILGPVRSGRVAFQEIKRLYPGGRLLIRYASKEVIEQLTGWILVRALDPNDVNSAGLTLEDLQSLDLPEVDPASYAHLTFDSKPPEGGIDQDQFRITYNYLNHVGWDYDLASGTYLRAQDLADGSGELFPAVDRLSGEPLGFENVIVLWSQHSFENVQGTILEIDLVYLPDGYGFLFRDGQRYDIRWSTRSGELRVHDRDGNPVPLKPGRTIFEVLSQFSTWDEAEAVFRYVRPALPTLTPTPTYTPTPLPSATATP